MKKCTEYNSLYNCSSPIFNYDNSDISSLYNIIEGQTLSDVDSLDVISIKSKIKHALNYYTTAQNKLINEQDTTQMSKDLTTYETANKNLVVLIKKLETTLMGSVSKSGKKSMELQEHIDTLNQTISDLIEERKKVISMKKQNIYNDNVNDSLELLVTANYYHYLVFAIGVIITIVLLFRVYLYQESSTIETIVLISGILLILYHTINILSKYIHFY
tara:strand:+ start:1465 stop:2115 length:651 start_codon:yes stop_codon:yes gene_type:complete